MSSKVNPQTSTSSQVKSATSRAANQPPPEDVATVQAKSWVVASFWLVAVLLGLPVWLWTTSIHRASLPTQEMLSWANDKACQIDIPLVFDLSAPTMGDLEIESVKLAVTSTLAQRNVLAIRRIKWNVVESLENSHINAREEPNLSVKLTGDSSISSTILRLQPQSKTLHIQYNKALLNTYNDDQFDRMGDQIVEQVVQLFAEERSAIRHLLSSHPSCQHYQQQSEVSAIGPEESDLAAKMARRRTRSLKYAPTYHISISLFTAGPVPSSWQIQEAVADYFMPLLNSFSFSNFTVDTQIQLYSSLSPAMRPPQFDSARQQWMLQEEDLGGFIDTANWPLSPHIGAGPTLNFIMYIPEDHLRPLVINGTGSYSWIVPQWGGVSMVNLDKQAPVELSKEDLQPVFSVFSRQLLSLLGVSDEPALFPLQIQSLTRIHTVSLMLSASSTLGSLARLAESLATIPIPEEVALRVNRALQYLELARDKLQDGQPRSALENARLAEAEAEKAFFEKDMVSQVYFPDEHKVAVYLPLLGPIGVTLLASLFREIKKRRFTKPH